MCDQPDQICTDLLKLFYNKLYDSQEQTGDGIEVRVYQLLQFITFVGHVGISELVYLDVTVYKELKRRNFVREGAVQKTRSKKSKENYSESIASFQSSISKSSASMLKKKQVI